MQKTPNKQPTDKDKKTMNNLSFYKEQKGHCSVCAESDVLLVNLSKHCTHLAIRCIDCHRQSIETDIESKGRSSFSCQAPNCQKNTNLMNIIACWTHD